MAPRWIPDRYLVRSEKFSMPRLIEYGTGLSSRTTILEAFPEGECRRICARMRRPPGRSAADGEGRAG